ncbi:MAG: hypothetical protein IT514_15545 [Burkholderiales bacterium]|nr:hypothetical protein [Burkholderiales bacterium]
MKLPTGWANLCRQHYDAHWGDVARAYCEARGLTRRPEQSCTDWLARMGAWAREHPPFQGRQAVREREPGEDDE